MRLAKALGAAGALLTAAIVGGTLIGSTLAVNDTEGTGTATGTGGAVGADVAAYCETFMDTLAGELGTTRDGLIAAGKTAANAAIDAALAAGDLTEAQATAMRERIAAFDGEGCALLGRGGFGGRGPGHGDGPRGDGPGRLFRGFLDSETFAAAAEALGLEASSLPAAVAEAGSLEALATAQGVAYDDVKAAILVAVQADLDAAVAAGNITQERADSVLERATTWLDEGGQLPGRWGGRHDDGDEADAGA